MNVDVETTIYEGENLTINVTFDDEHIIGTITIIGFEGVEPQNLNDGKATFTIENLKSDKYPITIKYDGNYNSTTYETTITVKSIIKDGENALNLTSPEGSDTPTFSISIPGATGNLTVTVDGKDNYPTQLDANGHASVTLPQLTSGQHNITVTYSGDELYDGISKNITINVAEKTTPNPETRKTPVQNKKAATKITAKNKKFKARQKVKKYTITLKQVKNLSKRFG